LHFGTAFDIFSTQHHPTIATMIRSRLLVTSALLLLPLLFGQCLTVEMKEYRIRLKSNGSGEATIRFINIMSEADDSLDITADDFQQLIQFYLHGTKFEDDNPGFRNPRKRLFEENGKLVGEIQFSFDSLAALRIFRYDDDSPYMYYIGNPLASEQLVESNGRYGGDWMPVIFWGREMKELYFKTHIASEVSHRRGLVDRFRAWRDTTGMKLRDHEGQQH
jgi:hypothetical protein